MLHAVSAITTIFVLNQYCLEILPLDPDHFIELPCNGQVLQREKMMAESIRKHHKKHPNHIVKTGLFHYPITQQCSDVLSLFISSDQTNHHDPSIIEERPHIQAIERLFVSPSRVSEPSKPNDLTKRVMNYQISLATGCSVPKVHPYPITTLHSLFGSSCETDHGQLILDEI